MSFATPSDDVKRACLERILTSVEFAQAGRLQRLLRFLAEQVDGVAVKETVIGVEVFEREPGYDPKIDSVVRTEVRRLRLKLTDYYAGSGSGDTVRVEIPKGSYQVQFVDLAAGKLAEPVEVETPAPPAVTAPVPRSKWVLRAGVAAAALVLMVLVAQALRNPNTERRPMASDALLITNSIGQASHPSLSDDGRIVAYSYSEGVNSGIYTLRLDTREAPQRLAGTRIRDFNPVIDGEGRQIAFLREEGPGQWALLVQGLQESAPKRWATLDKRDRVVWLPGGKRMIVSMRLNPGGPAVLAIIDAAGARTIVTSPPAGTVSDGVAALSPDRTLLAFSRATETSIDEIYIVKVGGDFLPVSEPVRLTNEKRRTGGFCFSPDGKSIIASLQRGESIRQLWRIPIGNPEAMERVPEAGLRAGYPTLAARAGRLVYVLATDDLNIYRRSGDAAPGALSPSAMLDSSPAFSPDGREVAFRSARSGESEIWVMNADGSDARRLTHYRGPVTGSPQWSPDGKWIVYDTRVDGHADIHVMGRDGSKDRRLTRQPSNEVVPSWSRDGRFIYYASDQNGGWELWKTPADGSGGARQVTAGGGFRGQESPDGKWLYFAKREPKSGLWRMPAAGGQEEEVAPLQPALWGGWAVTGSGVFFLDSGSQPPAYRYKGEGDFPAQPLTKLPVLWDASVAVSPDGRELLYCQLDSAIADLYRIDLSR
ncbi:MAG: PD40 domain-containing protein [Bryobacterales bacterium]|nr:PD40 domain-containing protein [Bryobacterales bacterium]